MNLNIITPVSRPGNLRAIKNSIGWHNLPVRWIVVGEQGLSWIITPGCYPDTITLLGAKTAPAGHAHRNVTIDFIGNTSDWIMSLDDDNILHPDLIPWLEANKELLENYEVVIFDQVNKYGALRLQARPDMVAPNCIDTAQYMWRGRAAEGIRFREDLYNADGYFIEEVYQRNKDKTLFVNQPLCYYNYLR
mgnify:CR=1 FL=1